MSDDKKPEDTAATPVEQPADSVAADDANKVEKLTKAGRDDLDPDEGSD